MHSDHRSAEQEHGWPLTSIYLLIYYLNDLIVYSTFKFLPPLPALLNGLGIACLRRVREDRRSGGWGSAFSYRPVEVLKTGAPRSAAGLRRS